MIKLIYTTTSNNFDKISTVTETIDLSTFGDGTLKCQVPDFTNKFLIEGYILWNYENDGELFALYSLVRHIQERERTIKWENMNLILPYIPNARQDRNVSDRLFTLKYFCELINMMNFKEVFVLDPHSDVSTALINRVSVLPTIHERAIFDLQNNNEKNIQIMFPDNGAAKKYSYKLEGKETIIGNKHRNDEGRIDSYDLAGLDPSTETVLICDDICSYGGTFVEAAKALKSKGVKKVYMAVSHLEYNVFKGHVPEFIDGVYTADTIYDPTIFERVDFAEDISYRSKIKVLTAIQTFIDVVTNDEIGNEVISKLSF